MQLMKSLLFNISSLDPITHITVPLVLTASATFASYLPARRAAAVNPVEALRAESHCGSSADEPDLLVKAGAILQNHAMSRQ